MDIGYGIGFTDKALLMFSMLAALFLYLRRVPARKKNIGLFLVCMLGMLMLSYAVEWTTRKYPLPVNALYITNLYDILLIFLCIMAVRVIKPFDRGTGAFAACASYASVCIANTLYTLINFFLVGPKGLLKLPGMNAEILVRIGILIITYGAVFILCDKYLVSRQENTEYAVDRSVYFIFLIIFISNIFLGSMENDFVYFIIHLNKLLLALSVLTMLFRQARMLNLREENARLTVIMESQKKQFEAAKRSAEEINIKAHDIKHFIDLFGENGAVPDPVVSALREAYETYEDMYDTGCKALDVTLTEKCRGFQSDGITFSVIADGSALSFMREVDIYVLFGNLIENAKEAVREIRDPERRIIGLYVKRTQGMVSLHMENTVNTQPRFQDGLPVTTKQDTKNHGFGTKSIRSVTEKYNGSLSMSCDDTLFSVDILFPVGKP